MHVIRPVGRDAAAKKYDLLSALMAHALAGDKHRQRAVLRLMALITTRYNWQRNELAIGQREIARLWCVDERTVKREMARLRANGWLDLRRAGARGRVSVYGLAIDRIMLDSRPEWDNVGPDFVARLEGQGGDAGQTAVSPTVVPFRRPLAVSQSGQSGTAIWAGMQARLAAEDPATFDAWFAGLADEDFDGGCLTLLAPTRFHANYIRAHLLERLRLAARREDASAGRIILRAPEG